MGSCNSAPVDFISTFEVHCPPTASNPCSHEFELSCQPGKEIPVNLLEQHTNLNILLSQRQMEFTKLFWSGLSKKTRKWIDHPLQLRKQILSDFCLQTHLISSNSTNAFRMNKNHHDVHYIDYQTLEDFSLRHRTNCI